MLIESGIHNSHIPMIRLDQLEGKDANGDVIEDTQWNEEEAAMEDLNFIAFGDLEESNPDGRVDVATIHWSNSMLKIELRQV